MTFEYGEMVTGPGASLARLGKDFQPVRRRRRASLLAPGRHATIRFVLAQ